MKTDTPEIIVLQGKTDHLIIRKDDAFAMKIAMLFEGIISDIPKKDLARKYGYTREHYYLLKHLFEKLGSEGLIDKKTGPKKSTKRTDVVNNQIIRLRFLDPDASVEVIGQKMRQMGFSISDRSINRTIQQYGLQKKLHILNPQKAIPVNLQVHVTKRRMKTMRVSTTSNETQVREILAKKVSGIFVGLWLLVAEHLRIGSWDVIKSWTGGYDHDIPARVALQIVHESALCVNGIRPRHTLCHQGFEVLNGLSHVVSDEDIHQLLNQHTVSEAIQMQENLGKLRWANGHYGGKLLAIDPHRIVTYSKRVMPKKKKLPKEPSKKVLQTFFCIDAQTGQPYGHMVGTSGVTATKATIDLLKMVEQINPRPSVILADTEHFTDELLSYVNRHPQYDILVPAPYTSKVQKLIRSLTYKRMWAGYAIASTYYSFNNNPDKFMLLVERTGEIPSLYQYKAFISTAKENVLQLLTEDYCQRWNIEEFFNFEGELGWNRASTMNLNVRYGKMSLALIAQSAIYQLRQKLPPPYKQWSATTMADNIFRGIDGDIRVHDDTILATLYNVPNNLNLPQHYSNLPSKLIAQGIDQRIPWLYGFKLDFSFK